MRVCGSCVVYSWWVLGVVFSECIALFIKLWWNEKPNEGLLVRVADYHCAGCWHLPIGNSVRLMIVLVKQHSCVSRQAHSFRGLELDDHYQDYGNWYYIGA